jgi:hypothetical protein
MAACLLKIKHKTRVRATKVKNLPRSSCSDGPEARLDVVMTSESSWPEVWESSLEENSEVSES